MNDEVLKDWLFQALLQNQNTMLPLLADEEVKMIHALSNAEMQERGLIE